MASKFKRPVLFNEEVTKEEPLKKRASPSGKTIVSFLVDNKLLQTCRLTLEKDKNSLLYKIADGSVSCEKKDGAFVIENCDYKLLNVLIGFLRNGVVSTIENIDLKKLSEVAVRFGIDSLKEQVDEMIRNEERRKKENEKRENAKNSNDPLDDDDTQDLDFTQPAQNENELCEVRG